jgi:hypothetical protein
MVIFGGIFEVTRELNDMHSFDFSTVTWQEMYEETNPTSPNKGNYLSSPEASPKPGYK